jgi:hypothetical protein
MYIIVCSKFWGNNSMKKSVYQVSITFAEARGKTQSCCWLPLKRQSSAFEAESYTKTFRPERNIQVPYDLLLPNPNTHKKQ